MQERTVEAGEIIYREGAASGELYVVKSGVVEVLRTVDDDAVLLTTLREGDIFGEMGVIRRRTRSTTTRAAADTVLLVISAQQFYDAFKPENSLALHLLRQLCERLRTADERLIRRRYQEDGAVLKQVGEVRLLPGSQFIEMQIGELGLAVGALPFRVGRRRRADEPPHLDTSELLIRASDTRDMDEEQFVIEEQDGKLYLRDLGSELGTLVDGVRIADFEEASSAPLRYGRNDVVAGGAESKIRFRIEVVEK